MVRDEAVLLDIARAARLVIEFKQGIDQAAFLQDFKTQSAVLHQLMVMGEAVKRLSPDFRARHSEIPWSLIAGMRDKLIHGYDIVDLDEVWRTAVVDVPDLLTLLEPLLPKQE
ncbi:MAG: HepT-like ribonuclease domain-containing protein [Anaerolineae bacterium]